MKYILDKCNELGYVQLDDPSTGIRVGSIPNSIKEQRSSLQAMALARYSRSRDSMPLILEELSGKDSSKKLENIAIGYGHASVGGMAHTVIYIEEVSTLDAMRFFDSLYVLDGQHRSTRYQDFSKARYMAIPSNIGTPDIRQRYKEIINTQMSNYEKIYPLIYSRLGEHFSISSSSKDIASLRMRSLDCTRYLLPLALKDGFGAVISIRELSSKYINSLLGSTDPVSRRLGDMLLCLMTMDREDYKGEGSFLLKHCKERVSNTPSLVKYLKDKYTGSEERWEIDLPTTSLRVDELAHTDALVLNLSLLIDPLLKHPMSYEDNDLENLGRMILSDYSHHSELGNEFLSGSLTIQGIADLGTIKDLIRHRSLRRFVPILNDNCSMDMELDRDSRNCFFLPPYLYEPKLEDIRISFNECLFNTYTSIKEWYREAKVLMPVEVVNHYVKRLLPHAHATQYLLSGSTADMAYLINLRTGLGGHIQYRMLCYEVARRLSKLNPMWLSLVDKIDKPDPFNREQFLGRS